MTSSFLELAQTLQMAIKALQMYTAAHPRSQEALRNLAGSVGSWMKDRTALQLTVSAGKVFVDGSPVEASSLHLTALVRQLSERQVAGFVLQRGVPAEELLAMLELLILKPAKLEELGGAAKVMAARNLRFISLSQTQYREVREGGDPERTPSKDSAEQPRPERQDGADMLLALDLAEALQRWRESLSACTLNPLPPDLPAANLGQLGRTAEEAGWGPGFPTADQMESLRQAMQGLAAEVRLSILKGLPTLPLQPAGLHLGFQALASEMIALSASELLAKGMDGQALREMLYGIIRVSPQRQGLLAGLEAALRSSGGAGALAFSDLLRQLEWDNQTMDEKIRRAIEEAQLWDLSLEQRLAFLRELLKQGRTEPFMRLLEGILERLAAEEPNPRDAAAQTLAGISHWLGEAEFPLEAEGVILDGLKGHFGWEPVPHIHRSTEEGMESILQILLSRGEMIQAQALVQELEGLLAFLEDRQAWRDASLERLKGRFLSREALAASVAALQKTEPEAVTGIFVPYFEFLGEPGARELVRILGEEPDRKRRGRLMDLLRALGPLALAPLKESLASPTWYLVRNTLNLLGEMGDAGCLGEISVCLGHGDGRVRRAAVRAVWKLGGTAGVPDLLHLLAATDPETQIEILFGLGQVKSGMAVHPLADFSRNPAVSERLRIKAIETLGLIGNPSALPQLAELLRRKGRIFSTAEPIPVRLAAARALKTLGVPEAEETLRKLIADEPRGADRDALQQILDTAHRTQGAP